MYGVRVIIIALLCGRKRRGQFHYASQTTKINYALPVILLYLNVLNHNIMFINIYHVDLRQPETSKIYNHKKHIIRYIIYFLLRAMRGRGTRCTLAVTKCGRKPQSRRAIVIGRFLVHIYLYVYIV